MEGKSVIMSALLLSLVLGQIQVEAKSCCPSTYARIIYITCRHASSREFCAKQSGCKLVDGTCPSGWDKDILEHAGADEFCKLGCSSSLCGAIITLQDASEVVSGAVEKCTQACSAICTEAPMIAVESA